MPASEQRVGVAVAVAVGLLILIGCGVTGVADSSVSAAAPVEQRSDSIDFQTPAKKASNAVLHDGTTRLVGSIENQNGTPIRTATVTVNSSDRRATANNIGSYNLQLEPGTYEVTVSADRFESKKWTQELPEGRWTRENVVLGPAPTELEGTVTNGTRAPVENAIVRLVGTGYVTSTDGNGTYALELEAGEYTFEAMADGYETERVDVDVEERRATVVDVELAAPEEEVEEVEDSDEASDSDERSGEGGAPDGDQSADERESSDADPVATSPTTTDLPSARTQLFTILFLGGTFVTTMAVAASVGLYRDWARDA